MDISTLIQQNIIIIPIINRILGPSKITFLDKSYNGFIMKNKRKNTIWAGSSAW